MIVTLFTVLACCIVIPIVLSMARESIWEYQSKKVWGTLKEGDKVVCLKEPVTIYCNDNRPQKGEILIVRTKSWSDYALHGCLLSFDGYNNWFGACFFRKYIDESSVA